MSNFPEAKPEPPFTLAIKCHWCGHTGLSMWEISESERRPVNPDNFYERLASKELRLSRLETICNNCNRPQPI